MKTRNEYRESPEYQIMRIEIIKEIVRTTELCIAAPDMLQKEYNRGYADALRNMLLLPDLVLPKDNEEPNNLLEEEEATSLATILISNRPNDGVW